MSYMSTTQQVLICAIQNTNATKNIKSHFVWHKVTRIPPCARYRKQIKDLMIQMFSGTFCIWRDIGKSTVGTVIWLLKVITEHGENERPDLGGL